MISIIIPAYNEEKNIPYIEKELFPVMDRLGKYEVIFVDDGSKDKTAEKIKKLKRKNVRLVQHDKNRGLGAAVRTGIKHCKGEHAITLDSDLTFHPKLIPKLVERYKEGDVDVVIGSPALAGYDESVPGYRILLSKAANLLYVIVLGKKITAVSPIFRMYDTKQLKELKLESNAFEINAEILAKLLMKGARVVEIPAKLTTRKYGESKLNNIKEIKNHIRMLSKIIGWRLR